MTRGAKDFFTMNSVKVAGLAFLTPPARTGAGACTRRDGNFGRRRRALHFSRSGLHQPRLTEERQS